MKRIISIILYGTIIFSLAGCNSSNSDISKNSENIETISEETYDYNDDIADDVNNEDSDSDIDDTDEESKNVVSFDWTNVVYKAEDKDGYKYDITIKLSPWILRTNSDTIDSAWAEVGNENELPKDFEDWNLEDNGYNGYRRDSVQRADNYGSTPYNAPMNEMYYCMGEVSVTNKTDGWNITESEPRSIKSSLVCQSSQFTMGSYTMGRIFYSSSTDDYNNGIKFAPEMTDNEWGPCSFVIMSAENLSPKNPNGEYYKYFKDEDTFIEFWSGGTGLIDKSHTINGKKTDKNIRIGVIGKDGKYIKP